MSIDVLYQPIDVDVVQDVVFPVIRGDAGPEALLARCQDPSAAGAILNQLRQARLALHEGRDYRDPTWGTCDPQEFLNEHLVVGVLALCRELWQSWDVRALTSIDLLPDDFPILKHYEMPIALFRPLLGDYPFIEEDLRTIANSPSMRGLVRSDHVGVVRQAVLAELRSCGTDADDDWQSARKVLVEALEYAENNGLSFTEVVD
jgi:hypothetical protein